MNGNNLTTNTEDSDNYGDELMNNAFEDERLKMNNAFDKVIKSQSKVNKILGSFNDTTKEVFYKSAKYCDRIGEKGTSKEFLEMSK